jgi:hypothetical protein
VGTQHLCPASPSRGGLSGLAGVTTRPAGYPSGGAPPAVETQLHLHHTPSRVPQRWGTTSCRDAAPLTPHAQPGTPAVGNHQLPRHSSTYTTRPAGYLSGGVPPAVERQLHFLTPCCGGFVCSGGCGGGYARPHVHQVRPGSRVPPGPGGRRLRRRAHRAPGIQR